MAESSTRAVRAKCANVLFVRAAAEALSTALGGRASAVTVNLPWGTLLAAVLGADEARLGAIRAICAPGARLGVAASWDAARDVRELVRLGIKATVEPSSSLEALADAYGRAGFRLREASFAGVEALDAVPTTWARKLRSNRGRTVIRIEAEA